MDAQYSTFPTYSASSVAKACMTLRKNGCLGHGNPPKRYIRDSDT
jgi:hypothetical protein